MKYTASYTTSAIQLHHGNFIMLGIQVEFR